VTDERRPLVIIGVGGGLVQWEVLKPGTGLPRLHVLDYDREGEGGDELLGFVEEIEAARSDLAEYGGTGMDAMTLRNMQESADEYRRPVLEGETARGWR
jgi:hypothetical protein